MTEISNRSSLQLSIAWGFFSKFVILMELKNLGAIVGSAHCVLTHLLAPFIDVLELRNQNAPKAKACFQETHGNNSCRLLLLKNN